jgi:phosphotransferase system  glucose/maltose/N-acetylglucosamine-specific IIC component
MDQNTGKYVIVFGLVIIIAGVLIYFFHDKFHWIGHLPGDIRIEKEHSRFYFPITTMIVFSLLLTLLVNIIKKFL